MLKPYIYCLFTANPEIPEGYVLLKDSCEQGEKEKVRLYRHRILVQFMDPHSNSESFYPLI